MPIYNEKNTVEEVIKKIEEVDLGAVGKEIILVDDGSTDGTRDILKKLENKYKVIYHVKNRGRGAAMRTGFAAASGDVVLVQDADFEFNPQNYPALIKPILEGKADVVFGSRFSNKEFHHVFLLFHLANQFLTLVSNILNGQHLTDMLTGYKVFRRDKLQEILPHLTSERFQLEPELAAQISKKKYRICELPLSFQGRMRTYEGGKKIHWKDGFILLWFTIKFGLFK